MTCADAREIMLTAEPDALRAGDDGLASHLARCAGCRHAAARILAAHTALCERAERGPRTTAQTAAERAVIEGRGAIRARRARRLIPALLAAAGVTAVLLVPRDDLPHGIVPEATIETELPPIVEGGASHVAVIATNRPDVTVVWQF